MKAYYRECLRIMSKYVKLSTLAREFGLNQTTLSLFMKDDSHDHMMSSDKAKSFYEFCRSKITEL